MKERGRSSASWAKDSCDTVEQEMIVAEKRGYGKCFSMYKDWAEGLIFSLHTVTDEYNEISGPLRASLAKNNDETYKVYCTRLISLVREYL